MGKNYPYVTELNDTCWFCAETENFSFCVYKLGGDWRHGSVILRASSNVKIGGRKYCIAHRLFAELDYKDRQTAFEAAKEWLRDQMRELQEELGQGLEVSHG